MKKQNVSFETARNIIKCLLALAAILCIVALILGEDAATFGTYAAVVAVGCIVLSIFVLLVGMKCPYCGSLIVKKCLIVKSCPHCGRDLTSGLKSKKGKH